jgi:phospholipase/carboxylesterase
MLDVIEIAPSGPARWAVIWLHGLGADGYDFEPLVHEWALGDEVGARFLLPHAPRRPVTLNGGMVMRAWYDIRELDFASPEDHTGIEAARRELLALVEREHERGVAMERILLAGFSQGGALALYTALRCEQPLAGVLALSSYLPLADRLPVARRADPRGLCIRMDHGESDPVVPFAVALRSRMVLEAQGFSIDFHHYPMGHSLCPEQIGSLRAWLLERLSEDGNSRS